MTTGTRNIIWVTAPSGAGKTFIINELAQYTPDSLILSDAAEILRLNKLDTSHAHHIHPDDGEAFLLTSTYHFDEAVRNICNQLSKIASDKPVLVELARGKGQYRDIDPSYNRLLELIPPSIMSKSVMVYVRASYAERVVRNNKRRVTNFNHDLIASSFFVPEQAMEGFYEVDDFLTLQKQNSFSCPTYVIENNTSVDELREQVSVVADQLGIRQMETWGK